MYWEIGFELPILLFLFFLIEWLGREQQFALSNIGIKWKRPFRHIMYYSIIILILLYSEKEQQFIYFQF